MQVTSTLDTLTKDEWHESIALWLRDCGIKKNYPTGCGIKKKHVIPWDTRDKFIPLRPYPVALSGFVLLCIHSGREILQAWGKENLCQNTTKGKPSLSVICSFSFFFDLRTRLQKSRLFELSFPVFEKYHIYFCDSCPFTCLYFAVCVKRLDWDDRPLPVPVCSCLGSLSCLLSAFLLFSHPPLSRAQHCPFLAAIPTLLGSLTEWLSLSLP